MTDTGHSAPQRKGRVGAEARTEAEAVKKHPF